MAARAFLLALLLPVLLLGPVGRGGSAWIHAHGTVGSHFHLLPEGAAGDVAHLHGWHAGQHHHESDEHHEDDERAPSGLVIALPSLLAPAAKASSPSASLPAPSLAGFPAEDACVEGDRDPRRAEPARSGWPPQRGRRTGVAALLRSSHALRI